MNNSIIEAALAYASLGWRVIPVRARDKVPAFKEWQLNATSDPELIRQMFLNHNGNVGIACGAGSGIVVIDVDLPNGAETLKQLEAELGSLPPTLTQRTGSGGIHLIFQYPAGHTIRGSQGSKGRGLGKNVDVRAEGNQIVVAPSIHKNGNPYVWENDLSIAALPPAWIARLTSEALQMASTAENSESLTSGLLFSSDGLRHPYVEAAIQNELTKMREAPEGERNVTLFKASCSIGGWIPDGHLSQDEAHVLLIRAAIENGYVESDGVEATHRTVASGLSAGMEKPRKIPSTPPGFSIVTEGPRPGLYYTEQPKEEGGTPKKIRIGPPLHILGWARDNDSEGWGLLLQWNDPDGKVHIWVLPYENLMGSDSSLWRSRLASGGWIGAEKDREKKLLAQFLINSQPAQRVLLTSRTGWTEGAFVFPDQTIYPKTIPDRSIILDTPLKRNPYRQGGNMDGWREGIATLATGNSRIMLALCVSFASALLDIAGQESGGVNLVGTTSSGKTTTMKASASVWGRGTTVDGYVLSWRNTDNAVEVLAALHSDTLLCLDELSQAAARVVYEVVYMIGNGQGKGRMNRKDGMRHRKYWRCMVLSSGEQSLDDKLRAENIRSNAGQAVRLIDIPADAGCGFGVFEDLHGYPSAQLFAEAIEQAAALHYGHASREFISKVIEHSDELKNLQTTVSNMARKLAGEKADMQVQRTSKRFALCSLAGELAIIWGILPWPPGSAIAAVRSCFEAWLAYRGGVGATEDMQIVRQVTLFIEQHGNSRFQPLYATDNSLLEPGTYHNRAGFRDIKDNKILYYVLPESFREICKGFNHIKAAQVLRDAGILVIGEDQRLQTKPPKGFPGWGRKRCYLLYLDSGEEDV